MGANHVDCSDTALALNLWNSLMLVGPGLQASLLSADLVLGFPSNAIMGSVSSYKTVHVGSEFSLRSANQITRGGL